MSFPQRTTTRSDGTHRKNEGQSRRKLSVNAPHRDLPQGSIWRDDALQSVADNAVLKTQTWGKEVTKRRGSKRAKVALGSQDRNNPAPHVRLTAQPTGVPKRSRSRRKLDQGGIQDASGPNRAPTARSPVAGMVELVKPLHAQWPSSDEPRAKAMNRKTEKRVPKEKR